MDKLKNVLSGNKASDPTGPHDSHLANQADPRVDANRVGGYGNTTGTGGPTGAGGLTGGSTGHTTGGLTGGSTGHTTTGGYGGSTGHTTTGGGYGRSDPTGPHDSHLANKADPRVDSTRVGGYGNSAGAGGPTGAGGLTGGSTGHTTTGGYGGNRSDPTGPHDSHLANKLDPRVDSTTAGGYGNTTSTGGPTGAGGLTGGSTGHTTTGGYGGSTGHTGGLTGGTTGHTTTGGYGGSTGHTTGGYGRSDPTGPHDSHLANKADPRVDADRVGGYGNTTHTGGPTGAGGLTSGSHGTHNNTTGAHSGRSDPTGPHDSHLANKADPRVDASRVGGRGNTTHTGGPTGAGGLSGTTGSGHLPGPAPNTAGPHSSNLLNKLDPRVDSDLDGSKTTGGNRTYG